MSNKKHRLHSTDLGNLISNLRGEIGEIISTWVLMKFLIVEGNKLRTSTDKDLENRQLVVLDSLVQKLEDEIIARLSELAEKKIGRLNFFFAQQKFGEIENDVKEFERYIIKNRIDEKRNYDISHKELPEQWSGHKTILIPYDILLKAIAKALSIMKKIDGFYFGLGAKYLWHEMRKQRYSLTYPANVRYTLLHYMIVRPDIQEKIYQEEMMKDK